MGILAKFSLIEEIAAELCTRLEFENIKRFLNEYKIPEASNFSSGGVRDYIIFRIRDTEVPVLTDIAKELGINTNHSIKPPAKPERPVLPLSAFETVSAKPKYDSSPVKAFISYETADVDYANRISRLLKEYNIEAFVAYNDAKEAEEFQEEILTALGEMDFFISIHTEQFSKSVWCQQEVGIAIASRVKIIPIKLRTPPDGFIGKIHAIARNTDKIESVVETILKILEESPKTKDLYSAKVADKVTPVTGGDFSNEFSYEFDTGYRQKRRQVEINLDKQPDELV